MFGIIGIIAIENMSKFNKKRQFTCLNSYRKGFFGYMGNLDQDKVDEQLKTVTEAGVNFIDTANVYWSQTLVKTMGFSPRL
jgi:predicted aldo/keto reductase-like oxidoreductase